MRIRLLGTPIFVAALVLASGPDRAHAQPPVEQPLLQVATDINPCTGETITLTFEGTRRTQVVDDKLIIHASGTVTTSDGYSGIFNRQRVFIGDQVVAQHFFDMEMGPDHERVRFTAALHLTVVDGDTTAEVGNISLVCIGAP